MRIAVISKSADSGGAAITSRRLTRALHEQGADATLVTADDFPLTKNIPFLADRLSLGPRLLRDWRIDTGRFGLPLWHLPAVRKADAVIINWVNQGMLSLDGIRRLAETQVRNGNNGKRKIIWTMHDMWPMTGICHHAMDCTRFHASCGECPLLADHKLSGPNDLSHKTRLRKERLYDDTARKDPAGRGITFVAVSNWLASQARASSLLGGRDVAVIPNPFRPVENMERQPHTPGRILFAAATLDNWIKGLDTFREAVALLAARGAKAEVWLMGAVKNPAALEGFALPTRHLGTISGDEAPAAVYAQCDAVANCSLYENLPGTLIEGQAYGAVPVAFRRGGQEDIIDHLSTGYLAEWNPDPSRRAAAIADGLEWALTRGDDTRRLMCRSADRFSYPAVANSYLELIMRT